MAESGKTTKHSNYVMLCLEMMKGEQAMELRQRLYDVDDLWELLSQSGNDERRYELIDGELREMSGPGGKHGRSATKFARFLDEFAEEHSLGVVTVETGYHPADDRHTLLLPDVAFISRENAPEPFPDRFVPVMPELVVEVVSPNDSIIAVREKAQLYLLNGTKLAWIALPATQSVEVWRMQADGSFVSNILEQSDTLSGEDVLPGFEVRLSRLFV